jgi:hypothetical protein
MMRGWSSILICAPACTDACPADTGAVHGSITMAVADTLIDFVDDNKDGKIDYQEFTKVLTAEDIMHVAAPRSVNSSMLWGKDGR